MGWLGIIPHYLGISGKPLGRPKSRKGEIGEFATCSDSRLCVLNTLASFRICPNNAVWLDESWRLVSVLSLFAWVILGDRVVS